MSILNSKQRSKLSVEERKRMSGLISDVVREVITPEGTKELSALVKKAGIKPTKPAGNDYK